jgi:hypothetical protein
VESKRTSTEGIVEVAGAVACERTRTHRGIKGARAVDECMPAYGGVVAATDIALERSLTVGRVAAAGLVKKERVLTSGRVFISADVLLQRTPTEGTVGKATDVFKKRDRSCGSVESAAGVVKERRSASGRILICGVAKERRGTKRSVEAPCLVAKERKPSRSGIESAGGAIGQDAKAVSIVAPWQDPVHVCRSCSAQQPKAAKQEHDCCEYNVSIFHKLFFLSSRF